MRLSTIPTLLALALTLFTVAAQNRQLELELARKTQTFGYWIDSTTGLMWAAKDNGEDLSWKKAVKYCHELRLAGYSDWRLGSLEEEQAIYEHGAQSPGYNPKSKWHDGEPMNFDIKGGIFITGNQWTNSRIPDDRGKPSGYAWRFDFNEGRPFDGDELWFNTNKRALCVRVASTH